MYIYGVKEENPALASLGGETRWASRARIYPMAGGAEGARGAREQISPLSETTSRNSRYSHGRGSGPYCRAETKRPRVRHTKSRKLAGDRR